MPENNNNVPETTEESGTANTAWQDIAGIPTTPIAPEGGTPAYPGEDISGIPTTPIAPPGRHSETCAILWNPAPA